MPVIKQSKEQTKALTEINESLKAICLIDTFLNFTDGSDIAECTLSWRTADGQAEKLSVETIAASGQLAQPLRAQRTVLAKEIRALSSQFSIELDEEELKLLQNAKSSKTSQSDTEVNDNG